MAVLTPDSYEDRLGRRTMGRTGGGYADVRGTRGRTRPRKIAVGVLTLLGEHPHWLDRNYGVLIAAKKPAPFTEPTPVAVS